MDPRPLIDVSIVEAGPQNADVLGRIHGDLFSPPWTRDDFAALLEQSGSVGLLAVVPRLEQPVGLLVGRVVADEAEILTLGVSRRWQQLGIAARLVEAFAQRVTERGATRVFLEVAADNIAARKLYLAKGFQEVGRRPGYYERSSAPPVDALVLSKTMDR